VCAVCMSRRGATKGRLARLTRCGRPTLKAALSRASSASIGATGLAHPFYFDGFTGATRWRSP
jgi:hypothetical protein